MHVHAHTHTHTCTRALTATPNESTAPTLYKGTHARAHRTRRKRPASEVRDTSTGRGDTAVGPSVPRGDGRQRYDA